MQTNVWQTALPFACFLTVACADAKTSATSSCTTYCTHAVGNCASGYDVDASGTCAQTCERFPNVSDANATTGDSLQCRLHYVGAPAAQAPVGNCANAGVSGNNICGTWCDVYCREAMDNCTGSLALYSSLAACQQTCAGLATTGKPGDAAGNTVQCRIYHLNIAGESSANAAIHCPHGLVSSAVCI